jgi:hypothetical protein
MVNRRMVRAIPCQTLTMLEKRIFFLDTRLQRPPSQSRLGTSFTADTLELGSGRNRRIGVPVNHAFEAFSLFHCLTSMSPARQSAQDTKRANASRPHMIDDLL